MPDQRDKSLISDEQKELAFYSAAVTAWFETQLEYDRNLLTLSSAGVAVLVTLLSTVGARTKLLIGFYAASLICFVYCIWTVLKILKENGRHLVDVIKNRTAKDAVLEELDELAKSSFLLGIVFSALVGLLSAVQSISSGG